MNKNLNVLFVGLGSIGKRHIQNLLLVSAELGINLSVDALRSSLKPLESNIQNLITNQYTSYDEIKNYDCIFITNPTDLHYETLLKLNNKAKYFFIEKPLSSRSLTDEQMKIFNNTNIYYVACPIRHTIVFKNLTKIIRDKKIYCARAICSSYLPDWRPNTDYRTVYSAKKESGGVTVDLIHDFDYLFTLFGFPNKYSLFKKKISNLEIESYDYTSFIGEYNDKYIELHLDYFGRENNRKVEIYTEDDVIIADFINSKIRVNNVWQEYKEERNKYCINEIKYFISLIDGKIDNINDIYKANETLKIIGE